jgi:hypothetical protein
VTPDHDRIERVKGMGFTDRQARFLVTVMLHSGVCIQRQYCASARLVHGAKTRGFFHDLVQRRYATAHPCARAGGRLYHIRHKRLYAAIGQAENRNRRGMSLARAVERLIVLDAVLSARQTTWLATAEDKLAYFGRTTRLRPDEMPLLVFQNQRGRTVRYFPDRLPIGVHADQETHEFVYLVDRHVPVDFRPFLYRHARLLSVLPGWVIHLVVPPHLEEAAVPFRRACEEELGTRMAPSTVDELRWYFSKRRELAAHPGARVDQERFWRARRAFGGTRYQVLYRHWLTGGEPLLDSLDSPVLPDALARGIGRIDSHVVTRRYLHLTPLVGTA